MFPPDKPGRHSMITTQMNSREVNWSKRADEKKISKNALSRYIPEERMRLMTTQQKDARARVCVCLLLESRRRHALPSTKNRLFVGEGPFFARKRRRRRRSILYLSVHKNSYKTLAPIRVLQTRYATALLSKRLCRADQTTTTMEEEDVDDDDNDDALFQTKKRWE